MEIKKDMKMNIRTQEKEIRLKLIKSPIRWVHLWVTEKCNLRCPYCYSYDNDSIDPTFNELKKRIKNLADMNVAIVAFYGGEPCLRKDLPELVKYAKEQGLLTYVSTNGSFNKSYLKRLVDADVDVIHLAIDYIKTPRKKVKKLHLPVLKMLLAERRRKRFQLWFNCCITGDNHKDIIKLVKLAKQKDIVVTVRFVTSRPDPYSRIISSQEDGWVLEMNKQLKKMKEEGFPIITAAPYFKTVEDYINGKTLKWKCQAGKKFFGIKINGEVIPCSALLKNTRFNIMNFNKNKFRKYVEKEVLPKCNRGCLQITPFCTSFYCKNPVAFIRYLKKQNGKTR